MKFKFLIPFVAFIGIAIVLGFGLTLNPRELPSALIDKPAPNFSLGLLSDPNTKFSPKDYQGKRWILNVWASWCAACRVEHPLLNQLARDTSIPLVGLNYKDKPTDARQWLHERGNPYVKVPMDIVGDAGIDWGVYGAPETFVINEQGLIIYKHIGPVSAQIIEQEILPLFANNSGNTQ